MQIGYQSLQLEVAGLVLVSEKIHQEAGKEKKNGQLTTEWFAVRAKILGSSLFLFVRQEEWEKLEKNKLYELKGKIEDNGNGLSVNDAQWKEIKANG